MLFTFIKGNLFNWTDLKWFAKGGGLMGGHASAGRYNGGEKAWYWIAAITGSIVILSGLIMNFPQLITWLNISNEQYQQAQFLHAVGSIGIFVVSFGHIYMGTIAMEGAFEAMQTGECDSNWAKEHHDLWYEELQQNGELTMQDESSKSSSNEPAHTA
jgi:formate dehydrogenase subunit gamma